MQFLFYLRFFIYLLNNKGFDAETIDKNSEGSRGFKYHIKNEHYMWNYVYYIAYLQDKQSTESTGIESYVQDKINKEEIQWFPTKQYYIFNN